MIADDSLGLDVLDTVLLGPTEAIAEFEFISQFKVDETVADATTEKVGVVAAESDAEFSEVVEEEREELGETETLAVTDDDLLASGLRLALPDVDCEGVSDRTDGVALSEGEPLLALVKELVALARALALTEPETRAERVRERDAVSDKETRGDLEEETLVDNVIEKL